MCSLILNEVWIKKGNIYLQINYFVLNPKLFFLLKRFCLSSFVFPDPCGNEGADLQSNPHCSMGEEIQDK